MDFQYQFTRHLASCNNINYGKTATGGKDFEPSGSIYGIFKTIEFAQDSSNNSSFNFNHVYVSNLIRTWVTAVLLYGTNIKDNDTLYLYVSPFLKEKHYEIGGKLGKIGNFPKEIYHTANKFKQFLSTLYELCYTINEDNRNNGKSLNERLNESLSGEAIITNNLNYNQIFNKETYDKFLKKIILVLPPDDTESNHQIVFEKGETGEYVIIDEENICKIKDTAGPSTEKEGFTTTGDLQKFMDWFESEQNYHGKNVQNGLVHIVTHSQIMQKYLLDTFQLNIDIDEDKKSVFSKIVKMVNKDYSEVKNSNSWRFKTRRDINNILDNELVPMIKNGQPTDKKVPILIPGIPMKEHIAKQIESNAYSNMTNNEKGKRYIISLCGHHGSVESLCKIGGKYSKKNRKQKTKKLKNRKNKTNKKSRK